MKHLLYIAAIALVLSSCKTNERVQDESLLSQPATSQPAPAPVAAPAPVVAPVAAPAPVAEVNQAPISVRSESVNQISNPNGPNSAYYVIIGSFSNQDNAQKYMEELKYKDFLPSILKSNATSYYRVAVGGYNDEQQARKEIYRIRAEYPKYGDTWLLESK